MASITLDKVNKRFGTFEAIPEISFKVEHGEFAALVGPSGCGKSTLLRMICGLEELTGGDILIDDESMRGVPPGQRGVAMVFQSYALYPHMTVAQNMGFALRMMGVDPREERRQVDAAAEILRLGDLLERKPAQLSGGQRQRVAIGRAIVRKPKVFLFDEPLSNLDASLRLSMRQELARLHRELGATMVYVTHDQVEAMTLANKIVVLHKGSVQQVGAPLELYHRPGNEFVAGFIGTPRMNFVPCTVTSRAGELRIGSPDLPDLAIDVPGVSLKPGDKVVVGVRPEDLSISDDGRRSVRGTVDFVERLGNVSNVTLRLPSSQSLTASVPGDFAGSYGEDFEFSISPQRIHLFDEHGRAIARPTTASAA